MRRYTSYLWHRYRYYYSAISLEIGVSMHKLFAVRFLANSILKCKKIMLMIRTRMRYVKILNSWRANKIGRSSSLPCAIFRTNHRREVCIRARCESILYIIIIIIIISLIFTRRQSSSRLYYYYL